MFLDFYGLDDQPFGVTPDPTYLFLTPAYRETLASLYYGIECNRGFLTLVGSPGLGKTTLLFYLLEILRPTARTVFLFQTLQTERDVIEAIIDDLSIPDTRRDLYSMHASLNAFLYREAQEGRRVILVIDEAQNLTSAALETVRLLSNFETPKQKLLTIILSGQPQLAEILDRPQLAQLRQRVAVMAKLKPLEPEEASQYIQHRLSVAGLKGKSMFDREAEKLLIRASEGVPRSINHLCFSALSVGCALGRRSVSAQIAHEVIADFASAPEPRQEPRKPALAAPGPVHKARRRTPTSKTRVVLQTAVVILALCAGLLVFKAETSPTPAVLGSTIAAISSTLAAKPEARLAKEVRHTFSVAIKPGDTIQKICQQSFGYSDAALLNEVLSLNPSLSDINIIRAGDQLVLPDRAILQKQRTDGDLEASSSRPWSNSPKNRLKTQGGGSEAGSVSPSGAAVN